MRVPMSNKKKVIFGLSNLAILLAKNLIDFEQSPDAFVVDDQYLTLDKKKMGIPILPFSNLLEFYPPTDTVIYVCVGYGNMNEKRKKISTRIKELGYEIGSFIHPSAVISKDVQLKNVLVFQNVSIDAFCTIGEGCIFYPGANISHHSTIGNYNFFAPSSCLCGYVTIQDQCFIGANSCIKNGCCVGERSLIGATAYVSMDVEAESVVVPPRSSLLDKKSSQLISKIMME